MDLYMYIAARYTLYVLPNATVYPIEYKRYVVLRYKIGTACANSQWGIDRQRLEKTKKPKKKK